jgi:hypothetical protein
MRVVALTYVTFVAGAVPKLTMLLAVKFVPETVTVAPPAARPRGGVTAVTVGAPAEMVSERVRLKGAGGVLESVPVMVKVQVQAAVGVPEMTPELEMLRPAGSAPLLTVVEKV